ncbi:hypothetical protein EV667_4255 [Ancylobacter aquaticus]|uniref:Uncharacterized protein n=1 Tax=Ancylobacter aquaticus TaxID=100 RepID=A0A4R1HGB9_ANCAQ|nr:hypothetical protein [Ancylobacter aquaticus]TCK19793.1 hypothetical protein EV667_4255 [Ancylobacter aquaticus]
MSGNSLTAACTKCEVALHVYDASDDDADVICPKCQTVFGKWGDVKLEIATLLVAKDKSHPSINVQMNDAPQG